MSHQPRLSAAKNEYAGTAAQYSWFASAAAAVCAKHFSIKLANIMSVAAAAAVPQYTFDSLYRPLDHRQHSHNHRKTDQTI